MAQGRRMTKNNPVKPSRSGEGREAKRGGGHAMQDKAWGLQAGRSAATEGGSQLVNINGL
jgi:hypothetical protein